MLESLRAFSAASGPLGRVVGLLGAGTALGAFISFALGHDFWMWLAIAALLVALSCFLTFHQARKRDQASAVKQLNALLRTADETRNAIRTAADLESAVQIATDWTNRAYSVLHELEPAYAPDVLSTVAGDLNRSNEELTARDVEGNKWLREMVVALFESAYENARAIRKRLGP